MKSVPALFVAFGFVLIPCLNVLAQEQTTKLPDDGWWIRYFSTRKEEFNRQVKEFTGKFTYSLVGTTVEDGETCRWIELKSVFSSSETENVILWKLLVLEKDLLEREQPLEALKRGWRKVNKLDVEAFKIAPNPLKTQLMIFPGMWQKVDLVDTEKVVDYQHGRLTIPHARVLKLTEPANVNRPRDERNVVSEYTTWFDPKIAPVFAAAKFQTKIYVKDELRRTIVDDWVVEDTGTDAKSQLPDNN